MIIRTALIAAAAWILLLVPTACPFGLLGHSCPADGEGDCGHEAACELDPCNILVIPADHMRLIEPATVTAHGAPVSQLGALALQPNHRRQTPQLSQPDLLSDPLAQTTAPLLC